MRARIKLDNFFGGLKSLEWLEENKNLNVNNQIVSEWLTTDVIPDPLLTRPKWDGENWIEGITEDILFQEESERRLSEITVINVVTLPTSSEGLVSGDLWNDNGLLKIM